MRQAFLTYKDEDVGIVREDNGGVYDLEIFDGAPHPIACGLPPDFSSYRSQYLHPVISNLAPEGWLKDRQQVQKDDLFGLLALYGQDCIGALGIRSSDTGEPSLQSESPEQVAATAGSRTISGEQKKLLVIRDDGHIRSARHDEKATHIAKYASNRLTDLVENEKVALDLVKALLPNDDVETYFLGRVAGINELALIIERFDRTAEGAKLRCEDFAQILLKSPGEKYDADYADLLQAFEFSASSLIDRLIFFKRLIAFVLIGNGDCHLKNWSLLEQTDGTLRLSPVYDVVNSYYYAGRGYSAGFGLRLEGQIINWTDYGRDVLVRIGGVLGLSPRTIQRSFHEIRSRETEFRETIRGSRLLLGDRFEAYDDIWCLKWSEIYANTSPF